MNTETNNTDRSFRPTKKLGQNFLTDKTVIKRIINSAELSSKDLIIEIGPGKVLTGLAKREMRPEKMINLETMTDVETFTAVPA